MQVRAVPRNSHAAPAGFPNGSPSCRLGQQRRVLMLALEVSIVLVIAGAVSAVVKPVFPPVYRSAVWHLEVKISCVLHSFHDFFPTCAEPNLRGALATSWSRSWCICQLKCVFVRHPDLTKRYQQLCCPFTLGTSHLTISPLSSLCCPV